MQNNQAANQTSDDIEVKVQQAEAEASEAKPKEPQQTVDPEERRKHNLVMLEAALYVAGRPLDLNELCSVITTRSKKKTETLMEDLRVEYASRNTSMEILRLKDERYVMQVKAEFTPLVKKLVNRPLLSSGPLKTLSYIAYRQPITSKRVIEVRGQHAYGHIKMLKDMGLVAPERNGRSIVLKTTDYFSDYFGLTQDTASMKRELKRIFGDALKDERQT
ncbi:MAG: SMC-Scp complex subunit ScpB [Candidatus Bathyarchaeia archaeon]